MNQPSNPRLRAIELVADVLARKGGLSGEPGEEGLSESDVDPRDAAQSRRLAYEVLRWKSALEWLAGGLLNQPLKSRDGDIHRLILAGLFELWKGGGAEHAAIFETAECARLLGKPWAVALINAVLRRFQREKESWIGQLETRPERFAHPGWLMDTLSRDWPDDWQEILAANNRPAGLWLRVNRRRAAVDEVKALLEQAGFEAHGHPHAPAAVEVLPPAPLAQLPGFAEGLWSVQDPAAQLATEWLAPQPHHRILDACAAPGGKSCHILERAPGARLLALDRSEARLERLLENAARLGLRERACLTARCADAGHPEEWWDGAPFDRILLDAPCSASGVIRRHPEIKWLRSPQQVAQAVRQQAGLLRRLWPLLKAGGILVYATCSVLRDENSAQIHSFIETHGDAEALAMDAAYGRVSGSGRQILPGEAGMDGFFYARIRKRA